jgi:hypothetical protein
MADWLVGSLVATFPSKNCPEKCKTIHAKGSVRSTSYNRNSNDYYELLSIRFHKIKINL